MKRRYNNLSLMVAVLTAVIVMTGISMMLVFSSKAETFHSLPEVHYTSVMIEEGQTLSELAVLYNDTDIMTNKEYVKEVKRINNLSTDMIHTGCYLTVFYY